jgi:hypothetical protein
MIQGLTEGPIANRFDSTRLLQLRQRSRVGNRLIKILESQRPT